MTQASIFTNHKSQAVRLPKAVAFPEGISKVDVVKLGQARLITPAGTRWDSFFDGPGVSDDFMIERDQPEMQERESC
ncbi:type II toxin-antitoxin system VapB family antitoxin [Endothiovibrio diazotrophicus]